MQNIWFIHLLRFFAFFLSLVAFSCHLANCILFNTYQKKTGIPDWLSAGHWQYLTWYISVGFSLISGGVVCLAACCSRQSTNFSLDKCVGFVALLPLLCSTITAFLFDSLEPWTNGYVKFERPPSGLLTYCTLLDESRDKYYPILFQRCVLSDITWISVLAVCVVWVLLLGCTIGISLRKPRGISGVVELTEEPKWGQYIPDPPLNYTSNVQPFHRQSKQYIDTSSSGDDEKNNRKKGVFYIEDDNMPPIYKSTGLLDTLKNDLTKGGGYLLSNDRSVEEEANYFSHYNDPVNNTSYYEDAYPVEAATQYTPSFTLQREPISYPSSNPFYSSCSNEEYSSYNKFNSQ